jgi:hypothetical protein
MDARGLSERILEAPTADLNARRKLHLPECFINGAFIAAKTGGIHSSNQAGQGHEANDSGRPL